MAVPTIILNSPNIMVTQSSSGLGIEVQSFGLLFGYVELAYETSDNTSVGQIVLFNPENAIKLKYGSTIYYILDENNVSFTEIPPP